jgi:hypothetical protein
MFNKLFRSKTSVEVASDTPIEAEYLQQLQEQSNLLLGEEYRSFTDWTWKQLLTKVSLHYLKLLGWASGATIFGTVFVILISLIPYTRSDEYPNYWRPTLYIFFFSMTPSVS